MRTAKRAVPRLGDLRSAPYCAPLGAPFVRRREERVPGLEAHLEGCPGVRSSELASLVWSRGAAPRTPTRPTSDNAPGNLRPELARPCDFARQ